MSENASVSGSHDLPGGKIRWRKPPQAQAQAQASPTSTSATGEVGWGVALDGGAAWTRKAVREGTRCGAAVLKKASSGGPEKASGAGFY